ncbi:relaxase/mobilization nuclease domain-containing protein [Pseudonocardia sp. ICBG601]|uniref:relaxase/mobilization nuclease domain-containing protein n=1 Tax=Pseudonocardia sp. ICBG601 TaxID=2846759 RepID=UPI001CF6C453|nr:relaxase/mobilization nuclease domain-containing protein [Pseudonocardia sp. ICBG601]
MIAKISRGWRPGGLVRYLMGPGRFNEHVGQRVVASWDGAPEMHQPASAGDGSFDVRALVDGLSAAAVAAGVGLGEPVVEQGKRVRQGLVWHCSLRNSPEDPVLSDEQWARVVEDLMDRTGIARCGDSDGCRWVAIRHADDHVHVAAVLVGQESGRRVAPFRDFVRAREMCRDWEQRLGLAPTAGADRSSVTGPSQAEQEKALRRGAEETSREWLRRQVRAAAVQGRDAEGFVAALSRRGVSVRPRYAVAGDRSSGMVGYAVSVPGDKTAAGRSVWFSGRRLAADLSLPNLRARWASADVEPGLGRSDLEVAGRSASRSSVRVSEERRAAAVDGAVATMGQATAALSASASASALSVARASSEGLSGLSGLDGDGVAHAAGDMLAAVGVVTAAQDPEGRVARVAGDVFDRATRVPGRVLPVRWSPVAAGLRAAAWELASVRHLGESGEADTARLIVALAAVVAEVAVLREAQQRPVQAAAARRGRDVLTAVPAVAAVSGARSPTLGTGRQVETVQARPEPARPVLPVAPRRSPARGHRPSPGRGPGLGR